MKYGREELEAFVRKISELDAIIKTPVADGKGVYIEMKNGHENEAPTLNNIEGINIPMLNGERFLLYPLYEICQLLPEKNVKSYTGKYHSEVEAFYDNNNHNETTSLLEHGSKAAEYVRSLGYDLPSLPMLLATQHHKEEINAIAEHIAGAMLIDDGHLWSCCRYSASSAWCASGGSGFFNDSYFISSSSVLPVALLD